MLNTFSDLLCSKLCWHNRLVLFCAKTVGGTDLYTLIEHSGAYNCFEMHVCS